MIWGQGVPWAAAIATQIAAVLTDVHRVDIVHRDIYSLGCYSLGCVLHELLTGDAPFHGTADAPLRIRPPEIASALGADQSA